MSEGLRLDFRAFPTRKTFTSFHFRSNNYTSVNAEAFVLCRVLSLAINTYEMLITISIAYRRIDRLIIFIGLKLLSLKVSHYGKWENRRTKAPNFLIKLFS